MGLVNWAASPTCAAPFPLPPCRYTSAFVAFDRLSRTVLTKLRCFAYRRCLQTAPRSVTCCEEHAVPTPLSGAKPPAIRKAGYRRFRGQWCGADKAHKTITSCSVTIDDLSDAETSKHQINENVLLRLSLIATVLVRAVTSTFHL